jgi:hypothetical protein
MVTEIPNMSLSAKREALARIDGRYPRASRLLAIKKQAWLNLESTYIPEDQDCRPVSSFRVGSNSRLISYKSSGPIFSGNEFATLFEGQLILDGFAVLSAHGLE